MSDIRHLVGQRIVDILTNYCIVNAPEDYAATEVRQGMPQNDPTKKRISIYIHYGNPANTESHPMWADSPVDMANLPAYLAPYEIGGGERRIIRFSIEIRVYLVQTKEERLDADDIGTWVMGRIEQAISQNMGLRDENGAVIKDEFGVSALLLMIERSVPREGGGPPNSFIWTGRIFCHIVTERD